MKDRTKALFSPHLPDDPDTDAMAEQLYRSMSLHRTIRLGIVAVTLIIIAFFGYSAITQLMGPFTFLGVASSDLPPFQFPPFEIRWEVVASWNRVIVWALVIIIAGWAFGVTVFWKKKVKHMEKYIQLLESQQDPAENSPGSPADDTGRNDRRQEI